MIVKNISAGSICVDEINRTININCLNFIIRMINLNFINVEEKFSMIDIVGNNVEFFPGDLKTSGLHDVLEKLNNKIIMKIRHLSKEDQEIITQKIYNNMEEIINDHFK